MSTRTFLNTDQLNEAEQILKSQNPYAVSSYVAQCLELKLSAHPMWKKSRPIKLGSWSRDELCTKSDIDLLFVGDEVAVKTLVDHFVADGIKIRYRMPQDMNDWTVNVNPFDVLALINAKVFFEQDQCDLDFQIQKINIKGLSFRKKIFKAMVKERKERAQRYDSITNYLEPNLKYGPGALRDLEQGLSIKYLFKIDSEIEKAFSTLYKIKEKLLTIRHYLNLQSGGDILSSSQQFDISVFFSYASAQSFMSKIEHDLSRVSFYVDWLFEYVQTPESKKNKIRETKINSIEEAFALLHRSPNLMYQKIVRAQKLKISDHKKTGLLLRKYINADMSEVLLEAIFRSLLLDACLPQLKRLRGHVQHDQYHRFSVDAHTFQAAREVLRAKKRIKRLGRLSKLTMNWANATWNILLLTALYHDLGKGLKGDHSTMGADIVKKEFIEFGIELKTITQVAWLVQNHLILSQAAFRKNPQSPKVWAELFQAGVKGVRLELLTIFTSIDIRATNSDAWNDWKERLLFDLAMAMQTNQAYQMSDLLDLAYKSKLKLNTTFVELLDSRVLEQVSHKTILQDFNKLSLTQVDLEPLVIRNRKRETWVRFHSRIDRPGLFLGYTQKLNSAGLSVQEAFLQTYSEWGVYDWFKIKTTKSLPHIKKVILNVSVLDLTVSRNAQSDLLERSNQVIFEKVEIISQDIQTATICFRGRDQRGALEAAAFQLYQAGFDIVSAKVHTWGRQIEDIFTVKSADRNSSVNKIIEAFIKQQST